MNSMIKKISTVVVIAAALVLFTGCHFKHEWQDATCTAPKTCKVGGETEGEALGHDWVDATCETPKTCSRCGETEGEPLGHDWDEATCETPKTCKRCGVTEGVALGHEWKPATIEAPKTCSNCGATEGEAVSATELEFVENLIKQNTDSAYVLEDTFFEKSFVWADHSRKGANLVVYDYDGNKLNEIKFDLSNANAGSYVCRNGIIQTCTVTGEKASIDIYDAVGENIAHFDLENPEFESSRGSLWLANCADDRYLAEVFYDKFDEPLYYLDLEKMDMIDASEQSFDLYQKPDYDKSKFSYFSEAYGNVNAFFVAPPDESKWGFVDTDLNEIAMYKDASNFNLYGYALVSEDRESYDIIDSDFNVIAKGYAKGNGAYVALKDSPVLVVRDGDEKHFYLVK